ncbi:MAG: hypothetical protein AAGC64_07605 [Bacteroidota bacterium]
MRQYLILAMVLISCGDSSKQEKGFYPSGALKYQNEMQDGKNHGLAKSYYENGNLKFEGEFRNGYRVGEHTLYFEEVKKPMEITHYIWKETSSYLSKMAFYDKEGIKTFESEFNPNKDYAIATEKCCDNDSIEFKISVLDPINDYVYARLGSLDKSFDFVSNNRVVHGDSASILIREKCTDQIQGMIFDCRIEFTSDTTGVTRAEHTYFNYTPSCTSTASL